MNDRIKLAELLDRFDFAFNRDRCPEDWDDEQVYKLCRFDPFTNANDDYAVLEWARETDYCVEGHPILELMANALHHLIVLRRDPTCNPENYGLNVDDVVMDIQKGDYARAALKVLK